jgi:hypothetical protein
MPEMALLRRELLTALRKKRTFFALLLMTGAAAGGKLMRFFSPPSEGGSEASSGGCVSRAHRCAPETSPAPLDASRGTPFKGGLKRKPAPAIQNGYSPHFARAASCRIKDDTFLLQLRISRQRPSPSDPLGAS